MTEIEYLRNKKHNKDYYWAHKEERRNKCKEYRKSPMGRASHLMDNYKRHDKDRGFDISNNITSKWIFDNLFTSQCVYCGDSNWEHLGADRINKDIPHTPDNVICCCGICNEERSDKFSVEEFKFYRSLHPRKCDIPKTKKPLLNDKGALIKKDIIPYT